MIYDHIVIGAGIVGSWTACILAQRGYKVLLIEQFPLPHTRGSSHGQSRITRLSYARAEETALSKASFPYWEKLQEEAGEELLIPCTLLDVAAPNCQGELDSKCRSLEKHNPGGYEVLDGYQLKDRFGDCLRFPLDYRALIDHKAGTLRPDKSLNALRNWFVRLGGELVDGCKVSSAVPGPPVQVTGSKGSYTGHRLVVCAGPWTNDILTLFQLKLPLEPKRVIAPYFKIKDGYRYPDHAVLISTEPSQHYYSLPCVDYPQMLKVAPHNGVPVHPDERDSVDVKHFIEDVSEHVKEHWPGLHPKPYIVEYCIYTATPDETLILDQHPRYSHILFGCGFSGSGFKISPAVGEILSDIATGKTPKLDYRAFKADRFLHSAKL